MAPDGKPNKRSTRASTSEAITKCVVQADAAQPTTARDGGLQNGAHSSRLSTSSRESGGVAGPAPAAPKASVAQRCRKQKLTQRPGPSCLWQTGAMLAIAAAVLLSGKLWSGRDREEQNRTHT